MLRRKIVAINGVVALFLVLSFDLVTYFFLPGHYAYRFPEFRDISPPDFDPWAVGRGTYPHGYFVKHKERGFDIGRNKNGLHWVDSMTYTIWSNSIGCFDTEHSADEPFVYFAGDSFTWGYTPFEQKFGTIIERTAGIAILKCGVTHTGQRHQFEKLRDTVKEFGKLPDAVFVFYFSNDIANDYTHPHSTVIRGWLVDDVSIDQNNKPVRHDYDELDKIVQEKLEQLQKKREESSGWWAKVKQKIKRYSLTTNMVLYARYYLTSFMVPRTQISDIKSKHRMANTFRDLHFLPQAKNDRLWYTNSPYTENNKRALLDFKDFSEKNNARFVVVLIPPKRKATDTTWYQEVRQFLSDNGIEHLDLAAHFKRRKMTKEDLYWVRDDHINPLGNRVVAEILIGRFPEIFQQRSRAP